MIYDKIKRLCKSKGISVSHLENEAKLSNGAISKWNTSSPTIDKLQSVARVLGITVDELLKEEE